MKFNFSTKGTILFLLVFFMQFLSIKEASAQIEKNQVEWTTKIEKTSDTEAKLILKAKIKDSWHIYDVSIPDGGPEATSLNIDKIEGASLVGSLVASPKAETKYDSNFEMNIGTFHGNVIFTQKLKVTDFSKLQIEAYMRYMACTDQFCTPPQNWDFKTKYSGEIPVKKEEVKEDVSKEENITESTIVETEAIDSAKIDFTASDSIATPMKEEGNVDLWQPVIKELQNLGDEFSNSQNSSLFMLFIYGFLGGLVALLTPCVWPMIPMTVSFFLKRSKDKKKAIKDAITYGIGIVVIYLAMGMIITSIFGANALNDLSTSALFNIIFFVILIIFAISFFGAFEIVLPAKWTNKMDQKADSTTGLLSIFFMAFTLVLVSFSCTGPIIGTLLVQAATMGSYLGPMIGMFGFSLALALPFTIFAIFPSMLNSLPKSGGWLNSVKVVLGFLELALAMKFLSGADLAYKWRIFDREVFLVLWIVIFALLGFYLLGKLRFSHDSPSQHTSVLGLFLAIISFSFSIYMIPGLWGAPLKAISAFAPPMYTQDFSLYEGNVHAKFDDYEKAMQYAKEKNMPVLIDFSGYACVNCRNMEADVWTDPRVKDILENKYVLVTLMVDDKEKLSEPMIVIENGKEVKLRTIGDKWSYLQRVKFGANTQPYYIALDHEGKPLNKSTSYDPNINKYLEFLNKGLSNFEIIRNKKQ